MQVTYISPNYKEENVTGLYVRCSGLKGAYSFKVFETATCTQKGTNFGKKGFGYTLREYTTKGENIPEEVKQKAIESKTTILWKTL